MVKVEVIEEFKYAKFDELKNIVRVNNDENGKLFIKDTFECDEKIAKYLTNEETNPINRPVVKVIEIIPEQTSKPTEIKAPEVKEVKDYRKKTTKTTVKKNTKKA